MVRVWGRTIVQKQDADISKEVDQAFSTKPCFGDIVKTNHEAAKFQIHTTILEAPVKRIVSEKCLVWSEEEYSTSDSMMPAICQECKNDLSVIKNEESCEPSFAAEVKKEDFVDDWYQNSIELYESEKPLVFEKNAVGRRYRSEVWFHFQFNADKTKTSCNYCESVFSHHGARTPTSMRRHLQRFHPTKLKTLGNENRLERDEDETMDNSDFQEMSDHASDFKDATTELPKIIKQEANQLTNTPTDNIVGPSTGNKIQENKPPFTYTQLIEQALMTEKDLGLPVSKIFSIISQKYPFYKMYKISTKCAITQALSAKGQFEKVSNPNDGKISLWRIKPGKGPFPDKSLEKTCPYCDKVTTTLYGHRIFVHHYGKFQCPTCHSQFNFAKDVVEHMKMEAHFGEVHCCECKKDYPMAEIESHYVMCATGCATCNKTFKHRKGVTQHRRYAHREQAGDEERPHCCEKCGKRFKNIEGVKTHIYRIHEGWGGKGRLCSICGMNFKTWDAMYRHKVKVHPGFTNSSKKERQCQKCGKQYSGVNSEVNLQNHLRTHEPPQFKCSLCGKMIRSKLNLKWHEMAHRGEKPFQCTLCSASFAGKPLLSQHMRGAHKIVGPQGGKVGWVYGKKQKQDDM